MRRKDPAAVLLAALLTVLLALCAVTEVSNRRLRTETEKGRQAVDAAREEIVILRERSQRAEAELLALQEENAGELEIYRIWMRETEELEDIIGH